jgi:hypothetical protein
LRRLNSIMTGLIAALLIVLALPRLVGALVQVPHEPLIAPVAALGTQTDRARRADNIDLEIAGRLQALEWIDDGRVWRALGAAQLKKASSGLPGKARRAALASARASLTESLKRAPANPFAWSRLAYVEFISGGETAALERALTMSMATGALEQRLVFSRLGIALMVWGDLTPTTRRRMAADIRTAARLDADRLNTIIRRTGAADIVRSLLRVRDG